MTNCTEHQADLVTSGFRTYCFFFSVISAIILLVSSGVWIWNRRLSYLRARGVCMMTLTSVSWAANIFYFSIATTSLNNENFLNSCIWVNFTNTLIIPTVLASQLSSMLQLSNKIKYNEKLGNAFKTAHGDRKKILWLFEGKPGNSEDPERIALRKLKYFSSTRFSRCVSLSILAFLIVIGILFAVLTCQAINDDGCSMKRAKTATYVGFNLFPFAIYLLFLSWLFHGIKDMPDPFGLVKQVKIVSFIALFLGVPATVLLIWDFNDYSEQIPYRFDWRVVFDLMLMVLYLYLIPFQVYKALKFSHSHLELEGSFQRVLSSPVGRHFFRQHLIYEMSVENLNFYEAATAYREEYATKGWSPIGANIATNIYKRYLDMNDDLCSSLVNVAGRTREDVRYLIENPHLIHSDIFNEAIDEISRLMESDSFFRFRESPLYRTFLGTADVHTANATFLSI